MVILAFALLSSAVGLGALALMPRMNRSGVLSRSRIAATHGLLGATGVIALIFSVQDKGAQAEWLAAGLLGLGLIAGAMIFLATRHKRSPPTLVLALHITMAGMGYLLLAGLFLG